MQKIILTIIILAVAKSIFAAPYSDATRMTTTFTIAPNLDIVKRKDALNAAYTTLDAAIRASATATIDEGYGREAYNLTQRIDKLILDKHGCLYTPAGCTLDKVKYKYVSRFLNSSDEELSGTWFPPAGVKKFSFVLWGGVGAGSSPAGLGDSRNTWLFNPNSAVARGGKVGNLTKANNSLRQKNVKIHPWHRTGGVGVIWNRGISDPGFEDGSIHVQYRYLR